MFINIALLVLLAAIAIATLIVTALRGYAFAAWVLLCVWLAYLFPDSVSRPFGFQANASLQFLIQTAMFGMGATLTIDDFLRVFKMPRAIGLGMFLQFSIMPLTGWALVQIFSLPVEVAAGVILVGSCPGGVSSNVITYLAKGDVALSVTMTACSTLISPMMTPTAMSILAGRLVPVPWAAMMLSIIWTVVAPLVIGLIISHLIERLRLNRKRAEIGLSILAMIAICGICAIIVADAHQQISQVGPLLMLVVALHNTIGYTLGYWLSRLAGVAETTARTISIEVGLQNGGLGAMLADKVMHSTSAAIAPALFAAWMNVSGSALAAWWKSKPTDLKPHPDTGQLEQIDGL